MFLDHKLNFFFLHNTQKGLQENKGQIRQPDKQAQPLEWPRANIHNAEKSCAKEAWLSKWIIGVANLGHDWGKQLEFWYGAHNLYLSQVSVKSNSLAFSFLLVSLHSCPHSLTVFHVLAIVLLTNLEPNTTYEVRVAAVNGKGQGEFSRTESFQTLPIRKYTLLNKANPHIAVYVYLA